MYSSGSSFCHLDHETYNMTSDRLMVYIIPRGVAWERVSNKSLIFGPGTITILESIGWPTPNSPFRDTLEIEISSNSYFGQIIGIVIGVLVLVIACCIGCFCMGWFILKRKRKERLENGFNKNTNIFG